MIPLERRRLKLYRITGFACGLDARWEMKLSAKNAPLVKEWADMVLFASYKTYAVKTESGKVKGQGGERRMYTTHHPC